LGLTTVVFLLNWLSTSIVVMVALALSARPASLMADLGLPIFAQVAAGVVLLDFSTGYVAHRLMHMWPAMCRFHRIHHSAEFGAVTATYGRLPVEPVCGFLFPIFPVGPPGIPAQAGVGCPEHVRLTQNSCSAPAGLGTVSVWCVSCGRSAGRSRR